MGDVAVVVVIIVGDMGLASSTTTTWVTRPPFAPFSGSFVGREGVRGGGMWGCTPPLSFSMSFARQGGG